jgi:formate dehydrogenase major subunit
MARLRAARGFTPASYRRKGRIAASRAKAITGFRRTGVLRGPQIATSYNRVSADTSGKPWSGKKALVFWDDAKKSWGSPAGEIPDFLPTKAPDAVGKDNGIGFDWLGGNDPFIMKPDGKAWLFAPTGLVDGPLPTHYEPYESPVANSVYKQQSNPIAKTWNVDGNPYHQVADPNYPYVISTYRLTEHHLSGTMSRWLPWLAELMPELFCEISPELAAEKGIQNTDFVTIKIARGQIKARALVTRRMQPFTINGKTIHEVGVPWHWGWQGIAEGDVTNNLSALVADPNVSIHEGKVFTCNLEKAGA